MEQNEFSDFGDVSEFEEPDQRCAICGAPDPDDLDYYKPKREGWPKVGPLCSRCYHKAADEERQSEEYFYKFYYYEFLAPHRVRESEDFNQEDPDQTFMKGEVDSTPWHESLEAFFEEYETPPNSGSEAKVMAQSLENSSEAVLYSVNRPGHPFTLSMETPGSREEVLMQGEEAKNLIAFWLDMGIIESMGRDHWGSTVLEFFATPWSAKELGIPNKPDVKSIEEAIEDMDIEGFERPKARPFRRAYFLSQILTQFKIDHPECDLQPQDFHSEGSYIWRGYSSTGHWSARIEYQTAPMNKSKLQIWGTFINQVASPPSYHGIHYKYDKKTERLADDPLHEGIEDDLGDVSTFEKPPRAKKFDRKGLLDLLLKTLQKDASQLPTITEPFKMMFNEKRWYWYGKGADGDIQVRLWPTDDLTGVRIYATVRVFANHKCTYIDTFWYRYVKGSPTLKRYDPTTND